CAHNRVLTAPHYW
nr:immunoglobulin heavy chain junction region [Macaca mulatta]MOY22159.1 immunoglobulin heavy chain junction region [Macaca mulatta]MOY22798.1 immunoglobulin heavy chain junction region [Macaca mulatta]MOY24829.1 immunoglobulin heavy chain junction region [Macaca mulatta]MOY25251.1 immunoglobulin heavy chain junction region [Macaca mulatta]